MMIQASKLLHAFVVAALSGALLYYFTYCVSKYRSGRFGVSTEKVPSTSFHFPSVEVCGVAVDFSQTEGLSSWISRVHHDFVVTDANDGKRGQGGEGDRRRVNV